MKPLTITAAAVAAFILGLACSPPRVITKTVEKPLVHVEPADNTERDSLRVRLAEAEKQADDLWKKGWQTGWRVGWEVGWEARGQ